MEYYEFSAIMAKCFGIFILISLTAGLIFGIVCLVRFFLKIKKLNHPSIIICFFLMILCVATALTSWIFNMGWYRFFLTFLLFPFAHAGAFIAVNTYVLPKLCNSFKTKVYTFVSYVTYLLSYLLFPDGGDVGEMYLFFGLIHSNTVAEITMPISIICFALHIVFTVLSIIESNKKQTL